MPAQQGRVKKNIIMSELKLEHRTRWSLPALISILLLASFIRLYRSSEYFPFWQEQVDDLLSVRQIWIDITNRNFQNLSLKGQTGTYRWSWVARGANPIYHGVVYYYILLPAAVVSRFDPYGVVVFLMALGVGAVYLLYRAGVLLFGNPAVGLLAAFLGAISFWLSAYSRWIWTPSMIPFFSILSLVAFLEVLNGYKKWWYVLAFSLSLGSQIHTSGYIVLIFFLAMALWYKPKLPSRLFEKFLLVLFFFLPIIPSMLYETTSGFTMIRALSHVATGSFLRASTIGQSLVLYVVDALGLTVVPESFVGKIQGLIEAHAALLGYGAVIFLLVGIGIIIRKRKSRPRLLLTWWLLFLPIPVFVEYLYLDQTINDYSRMNNLVFAFPMLLLCIAYGCIWLWRSKSLVFRMSVLLFIFLYISANGAALHRFLWSYNDKYWAYKELKTVASMIPKLSEGKPYDVYIYRYHEGSFTSIYVYEPLYFIDLSGARMPETFNDVSFWGIMRIPLQHEKADMTIFVIDRTYLAHQKLPEGTRFVGQTEGYQIYRVMHDIRKLNIAI